MSLQIRNDVPNQREHSGIHPYNSSTRATYLYHEFKIIFWILNILNRLSFPKRRNRTAFVLETYACTQLHSNAFKEIRYYGVFPSFQNTTNRVNDSCSTYNFLNFIWKEILLSYNTSQLQFSLPPLLSAPLSTRSTPILFPLK